nr:MAG TPA: hypothetical protein [Caudoviricetes sp.]
MQECHLKDLPRENDSLGTYHFSKEFFYFILGE